MKLSVGVSVLTALVIAVAVADGPSTRSAAGASEIGLAGLRLAPVPSGRD